MEQACKSLQADQKEVFAEHLHGLLLLPLLGLAINAITAAAKKCCALQQGGSSLQQMPP
jgi:hypothetical protein